MLGFFLPWFFALDFTVLLIKSTWERLSHVQHQVVKFIINGPVQYLAEYQKGLETFTSAQP